MKLRQQRMMNLPEDVVQGTHNTEEGFLRRLVQFNQNRNEEDTGKERCGSLYGCRGAII